MEGFAAFVIVGGLIVGTVYSRLTKASLDIKGVLLNIARALWRFLLGGFDRVRWFSNRVLCVECALFCGN